MRRDFDTAQFLRWVREHDYFTTDDVLRAAAGRTDSEARAWVIAELSELGFVPKIADDGNLRWSC